MSTFESLVADLTRDAQRVQPKDALQFCANWFQSRLEEQRTRIRDVLAKRYDEELSAEYYLDRPINAPTSISPFTQRSRPFKHRPSMPSLHTHAHSPFGTLNVPGNALLSNVPSGPSFKVDDNELSPTSTNGFTSNYDLSPTPTPSPGDYLHPPSATILARRTSVSAESILVDSFHNEIPPPIFSKSQEQLKRIKSSIANNFIFRDLDEEQETGVLNAMEEVRVPENETVIRQGDVGEYFYVVESGVLHCYIHPDPPLPPPSLVESSKDDKLFVQPGYHPVYGRKVAECTPGTSFGELALMYGHPRAATVVSIEASTLWRLDRITFRTIILKSAHRRRTMYEQFLSTVPLLSSLSPEERSKIADALTSRVYWDGEEVVKQGEMGDTFFFVEEGEAVVTKKLLGEDKVHEVNRLRKGGYFGELSLLSRSPRAATVSAVRRSDMSQSKLKVAALDASAFTRLLGPLREIMERKAGESYGPTYVPNRK